MRGKHTVCCCLVTALSLKASGQSQVYAPEKGEGTLLLCLSAGTLQYRFRFARLIEGGESFAAQSRQTEDSAMVVARCGGCDQLLYDL